MDKYAIFYVSLFSLGLAAILTGVGQDWRALIAVGSAFVGTSIGGSIQRVANRDFVAMNKNFEARILNDLTPGFSSAWKEVKAHSKTYYLYHVTRMDGNFVWRCSIFDFSKSVAGTKLETRVKSPNPNSQETPYLYEAGIRQERLIIFGKPEDGLEAVPVYVFPFAAMAYRDQDAGIIVHQTYDSTHSISPAIISECPIQEESDSGTVDPKNFALFDEKWRELLKNQPSILPRVDLKS